MQNQGGLIRGTSTATLHNRTIAAPTLTNPEGEINCYRDNPQVRQRASNIHIKHRALHLTAFSRHHTGHPQVYLGTGVKQ